MKRLLHKPVNPQILWLLATLVMLVLGGGAPGGGSGVGGG